MKVYSQDKLPIYQVIGNTLRVHWDFTTEQSVSEFTSPTTVHVCNEAVCHILDDRATLIEKIIGSKYTTGAEIAAINNGGDDYKEYQTFRKLAKQLADDWLQSK